MNYFLRIAIAVDGLVQAAFRYGTHGVTISSRIGTAAAHGHAWGRAGWWLLDHTWPFGKDADGTSHCASAIENDTQRALLAVNELQDPVVQAYIKSRAPTKQDVQQ